MGPIVRLARSSCRSKAKVSKSAVKISEPLWREALRCGIAFSFMHTSLRCNRPIRRSDRLARWLLMAQDRLESNELLLTHEFLSLMLGVRRAGVTTGLKHFENKGLIATSRGAITIQDRGGLEEAANGFYGRPE